MNNMIECVHTVCSVFACRVQAPLNSNEIVMGIYVEALLYLSREVHNIRSLSSFPLSFLLLLVSRGPAWVTPVGILP